MTVRALARPLALALLGLALLVPSVLAQTLTERVTDEDGLLTAAQVDEAQAGIDALEDEHGIQLWALFVATTGGEDMEAYIARVAEENAFGGNDALLAVAVEDRRYQLWVSDALTDITNDELDRINVDEIEPQLGAEEWGAAAAAAATGLGEASAGDIPPDEEPQPQPVPPGETSDGGGPGPFTLLLPLLLIGGGAWLIWSRWQSGRAAEEDDRERDRRLRRLAQETNTRLIQTDELLRHNRQELGFVEAEFGPDAAGPFAKALGEAQQELQAAFRARQQLDDDVPEEAPQREKLLNEIVARTDRARQLVEEQTAAFQELRALEKRAPEILAGQADRVAALTARLPTVEAQLETLADQASGSSQAVRGNVAEARKRIELSERAAAEGRRALERGTAGEAARAAKASQDTLAQAVTLLDAIDHEVAALDEARGGLQAAVARARADLELARTAVNRSPGTDQADELAAADAKLDAAAAASQGTPRDLVLAYRLAREAESEAESVVAGVAEGEERRAKERAAVDASLRAAELSVDRAEEFIAARHHGVGRRPRTALSEADAALGRAHALRETDARAAIDEARRAAQLADEAYERARRDFGAADQFGRGGTVVIGGQPFPMGRGSQWGGDVGGAIIGGIIGSILSGGGRRGGGFGGGFGGGGFGGFGGGGGGFGGGRSFGGGFGGGGGGRSRGGGW